MTEILRTGILNHNLINYSNKYNSNLNSTYLNMSGLNCIIYDILDKHRTISYDLYHYICDLKQLTEHGNCLCSAVTKILSYPLYYQFKT